MSRPSCVLTLIRFDRTTMAIVVNCSKQSAKIAVLSGPSRACQVLLSFPHVPNTSSTFILDCVKVSSRFVNVVGGKGIYIQIGIGLTANVEPQTSRKFYYDLHTFKTSCRYWDSLLGNY
jgi:hypothetical protein